jgi:enterochelin esterase-like enzyme
MSGIRHSSYKQRRRAGWTRWLVGLSLLALIGAGIFWTTNSAAQTYQPPQTDGVLTGASNSVAGTQPQDGVLSGAIAGTPLAEVTELISNLPPTATSAPTDPAATPTPAPATATPVPATPTPIPVPTYKVTQVSPAKQVEWKGKGTVQDRTFFSPILNREVPVRVYLPPNYGKDSQKRYPVLYMLHGLSGSNLEWIDYGIFGRTEDLILAGTITPTIVVLPFGDKDYWMNHQNNGPRWSDYVATDVVGHIDVLYRTVADPKFRAIGGHSMGAHGALQIGFNHSDVFNVIGAHSPTLRTQEKAYDFFKDPAHYPTVDPVSLAAKKNSDGQKIWIDIGNKDSEWLARAQELHNVLTERNIPHEWHEWEGAHAGEYWAGHLPDYLYFYASSFGK